MPVYHAIGQLVILFSHNCRWRVPSEIVRHPHVINNIICVLLPFCSTTEVPKEMVDDLLADLRPRYLPEHYNLLFHNCNTFSNELCQLLTGEGLPVSARDLSGYHASLCPYFLGGSCFLFLLKSCFLVLLPGFSRLSSTGLS